jgi:hypothetical protein
MAELVLVSQKLRSLSDTPYICTNPPGSGCVAAAIISRQLSGTLNQVRS